MDKNSTFKYIILYMIFIYFLILYLFIDINELLTNVISNDRCICIITKKPQKLLLDFLNNITSYDIYIMIDDESENYQNIYQNMYNNINFIQIDKNICKKYGYINVTLTIGRNEPSGWEKALYYFSRIQLKYDKIWFIEDDVYFYNENTLLNIDIQYPYSDILSKKYETNMEGNLDSWHWNKIINNIKLDPPYYKTMVCAIRISHKLLKVISDYAKEHNTLFFLETMYPTLAIKNKLIYDTPPELYTIEWRKDWKKNDVNKINLFHPIKDHDVQFIYKFFESNKIEK